MKMLVCGYDISAERELPEVDQLRFSILNYMDSDAFEPSLSLDVAQLESMFPHVEPADHEAPEGFAEALLYVEASTDTPGLSGYDQSMDRIVVGKADQYAFSGVGLWKEAQETSWVGESMEM